MLARRQQKLNSHLKDLKKLADVNNALVLVTNQVHSKPTPCGDPTKPIGGHILAHASTFRLYLRKAKEAAESLASSTRPTSPTVSASTRSPKKVFETETANEKQV